MNNKSITLILVVFAIINSLIWMFDEHDQQMEHHHYCRMVALWHATKDLPPEKRLGWPPYKGECDGDQ